MASEVLEKLGYKQGEETPDANVDPNKPAVVVNQPAPKVEGDKPTVETAVVEAPVIDFSKLDEKQFIEAINQRTGGKFTSFEELTPKVIETEEEKNAAAEKRRQDVIKYALDKKIYDSKTLENYAADKAKSTRELAFESYKQDVKAANPEAKDEEIQNMFDLYYAEETDDDKLWINKQREIELQQRADSYLNKKYENVIKADDVYGKYEQTLTAAQHYASQVDKAHTSFNPLQKFTIDDGAGNKDEISYNIPVETLNSVKEELLNSDTFNALRNANIPEDAIQMVFADTVMQKDLPKIITEVARSYASTVLERNLMGRKNIPVTIERAAGGDAEVKHSTVLAEVLNQGKPKQKVA